MYSALVAAALSVPGVASGDYLIDWSGWKGDGRTVIATYRSSM